MKTALASKSIPVITGTRSEVVTVTPELAEKWLGTMVVNRTLRNRVVDQYARDMKAGHWPYNGAALLFASEGEIPDYAAPEGVKHIPEGSLLDGQHRLWACMQSGTSFVTRVEWGVDPAAWNTIDSGISRTPGDMLVGERYRNDLSAALVWLWKWQSGSFLTQKRPSRKEREGLLVAHPGLRDAVLTGREWADKRIQLLPRSTIAFLLYVFANKSQGTAEVFLRGLISGEDLHATGSSAPITVLRTRLLKTATRKDRFPLIERQASTIKAWNLFRKGAVRCTERMLVWARYANPPEKFPTIQ